MEMKKMTTQNEITVRISALLKDAGIDSFTSHLRYGQIARQMERAYNQLGDNSYGSACYYYDSVSKLVEALNNHAAGNDVWSTACEIWEITECEWVDSIKDCLLAWAYGDGLADDLIDAKNGWYEAE